MQAKLLMQDLWQRWQWLLRALDIDLAEQWFQTIVTAYSQSDRHYHTLQHIQQVLEIIDSLQAQDSIAVQLAAWFHDVVYNPQSRDNEEKSAAVAEAWLRSRKVSEVAIAKVTRLILATKSHQPIPEDLDSQVLLDADLAILGAEPSLYWQYAAAIRQEYAWVPETQYREGRRQVLERFLQRDRLYFTESMFDRYESAARRNLQAEIQSLIDILTVLKEQ